VLCSRPLLKVNEAHLAFVSSPFKSATVLSIRALAKHFAPLAIGTVISRHETKEKGIRSALMSQIYAFQVESLRYHFV